MKNLRRLLPAIVRRRWLLAGGMLCLLVSAGLSTASAWVLRDAIDALATRLTAAALWTNAGLFVAFVVGAATCRYLTRTLLNNMTRDVVLELRNELFAHLTKLPARFYSENRIGDLISRFFADVDQVRGALSHGISQTADAAAYLVGTLTFMAMMSPRLLGFVALPLLLVPLLVAYCSRRIREGVGAVQEQTAVLTGVVQENLVGARLLRAYAQEDAQRVKFAAVAAEHVRRARTLIRVGAILQSGLALLLGSAAVMVLGLGGGLVMAEAMTIGELVAFGACLGLLSWPVFSLGDAIDLMQGGEAGMVRINGLLDTVPSIRDEHPVPVADVRGAVSIRNLTFRNGGRTVLEDVSLEVKAGQTIGIVGPIGCGKTTLVSLIPRIWDPPPGTVFVDDVDVRAIPLATLRGAVGFVPQDPFLFSATLRENIGLGAEDDQTGRVEAAADLAQLDQDVARFPRGYETPVGERGIALSGGQRQRATLARAIAADPRILILDDSLSAVDAETEERVLYGLRGILGGRTTFLVSHRVSTVRHADVIVVLANGRVVEQGTHNELQERGSFYADLCRRQLVEEEIERAPITSWRP